MDSCFVLVRIPHHSIAVMQEYESKALDSLLIKVGTVEGTSSRDLLQGLVPCSVFTMELVTGASPLKGLHAGTC